ncbi:MAG: hypothetical protein H7222_13895 [Methylotenera sp.]|nr:hypothetical protein [Oligoflexia bacterium]
MTVSFQTRLACIFLLTGLSSVTTSAAPAPSPLQPKDLDSVFERHALLSYQPGFNESRLFQMHSIHFSPDLKSAVFIRFDIQSPKAGVAQALTLPAGGGEVRFGDDAGGKKYFAYFMGFSHGEADQLATELQTRIAVHTTARAADSGKESGAPKVKHTHLFDWIANVEAAERVSCSAPSSEVPGDVLNEANLRNVTALSNHSDAERYNALALSCIGSYAEGLWAGSAGMIVDVAKFQANLLNFEIELVTHPLKAAAELKAKWEATGKFISDFKKTLQKGDLLKGLSFEVVAPIACSLVGSLVPGLLVTALSDGAAAPELLLSIKNAITDLMKVERFLAALNRAARAGEAAAGVMNPAFYARLFKGAISEARLAALETFAKIDELAFAKQMATCGI